MYKPTKLLLVAVVILATGCATIIHGTTQEVGITSSPAGATVIVDGTNQGQTPVAVELSRKEKHTIKVSLDGYESFEMIVNRKVSGWVWGNIVFGGLIGLAVDAGTGGMYKLDPEQINAQLSNSGVSSKLDDGTIFMTVVLKPHPNWERIGTLTQLEP